MRNHIDECRKRFEYLMGDDDVYRSNVERAKSRLCAREEADVDKRVVQEGDPQEGGDEPMDVQETDQLVEELERNPSEGREPKGNDDDDMGTQEDELKDAPTGENEERIAATSSGQREVSHRKKTDAKRKNDDDGQEGRLHTQADRKTDPENAPSGSRGSSVKIPERGSASKRTSQDGQADGPEVKRRREDDEGSDLPEESEDSS